MENASEKQISPSEGFAIIDAMINTAKNRLADDGFYFILWGWLVFVAAMANYVSYLFSSRVGEHAWWLMLLGAVISVVYSRRQGRKEKVRSYIDVYLTYCWVAFGVALALTLVFMGMNGFRSSYFFLMLLYGMATIVSGGLLDFKPLVIGGVFSFGFATLTMFVNGNTVLLCICGALLAAYIIPGHLLQLKYKSQT